MSPLRILVVEDEPLIAMMIEDAVERCGHVVAAAARNITDAMQIASLGDFDAALLDLNLNGQKAHALAVVLQSQHKPFAFITGYGEDGVLEKFADAPLLKKPFREADLCALVERLRDAQGPAS